MFGQNSEYWNSSLVNDQNTTKNIDVAEGFDSAEDAENSIEKYVKPYGKKLGWSVTYSIDVL